MPPKKKKGDKNKGGDEEEVIRPQTAGEPTEKEIILQKEWVYNWMFTSPDWVKTAVPVE